MKQNSRIKKFLTISSIAAMSLSANFAYAFEPFVIHDIRIEGIQRTEAGTVFSYLPVHVGETLTNEKATESIKALFDTGFFKDVRIESQNNVMIVSVQERPAIASIEFVGLKEFSTEDVLKALKAQGISQGQIFDKSQLERAEQEFKKQYLTKGKYSAKITTTVTPLERNRVGLNFNIEEGEAAKIKQIHFVGNNEYSEDELLKLFTLTTPTWISWYTKNDQYSKQKLAADLEKVRSFYMDAGYLSFEIVNTQVSISPNKEDIFITININEGKRYQVSEVKIIGDLSSLALYNDDENSENSENAENTEKNNENLVENNQNNQNNQNNSNEENIKQELEKLVELKVGDVFSRQKLNDSTKNIIDRLGKSGYAFANVNAAPQIDEENAKVSYTIFVDPGKRVYVNRVNVVGNSRTRDEVVRRELRQMESAWYNSEKITLSKERIQRLGYFTETDIETKPVAGTDDQVDINLKVKERPTGNIMFGIGTSNIDRLILSASLSQDNFLGSGNMFAFTINSARSYRTYSVSYENPYFTVDGVSQGFDIYHRTIDTSKTTNTSLADYKTTDTGAAIKFGLPISEYERINFGIGVNKTIIDTFENSPQYYKDYVKDFGRSNLTIPLTFSWTKDQKDHFYFPTKGSYHRLATEIGLPGGDLQYYRVEYRYQKYIALNKKFTLMLGAEAGYADGYGGDKLPFYKNFYAGGIGSVRGYQTSSLGPQVSDQYGTYSVGGKASVIANAEVYWALPGMEDTVRMGVFFDIGQVYASNGVRYTHKTSNRPRYSVGVSTAWLSPIGPLKLSFGFPLNKQDGDKTEQFQFQLGSVF